MFYVAVKSMFYVVFLFKDLIFDNKVPGILCNASKKRIWDLFSLDLLNKHLAEAPDPTELRQLMETRSNDRTKPFRYNKKHAILNLNWSNISWALGMINHEHNILQI